MSDDDLPEFYIEAAQVVVGMHPFPSAAETGIAIEAVRRTILQARSQAFEESAKIADGYAVEPDPDEQDPYDEWEMGNRSATKRISQAIRQHSQKGEDV